MSVNIFFLLIALAAVFSTGRNYLGTFGRWPYEDHLKIGSYFSAFH